MSNVYSRRLVMMPNQQGEERTTIKLFNALIYFITVNLLKGISSIWNRFSCFFVMVTCDVFFNLRTKKLPIKVFHNYFQ